MPDVILITELLYAYTYVFLQCTNKTQCATDSEFALQTITHSSSLPLRRGSTSMALMRQVMWAKFLLHILEISLLSIQPLGFFYINSVDLSLGGGPPEFIFLFAYFCLFSVNCRADLFQTDLPRQKKPFHCRCFLKQCPSL